MFSSILSIALRASIALASKTHIKNIVTFGDSYTDISVALFPLWPIYAADYGHLTMFDFARSGATCSNGLTPRTFPGVLEDEIPAFENATAHGNLTLPPSETLYTLWIGTNDVGVGELLTGQAVSGVSIVNTSACAVSWVQRLYDAGARNFFFQNMVPLDRVPLYSSNSYPNKYWTEQRNSTEWNVFMKELVAAGNSISELMLANLAHTLPDSHVCLFDSHALFTDILDHPNVYLNGTAPLNTTGAVRSCVYDLNESTSDPGNCTVATGANADSFVWFDELHPSEQSQRVVAKEIVSAINGTSERWLTCFS
ncbi:carbohydrate esterase family 16 protein [Gautieria morchelliformis]|nr:carbohydrate esterase family 16 protein [Gautieria morchelliformis]